MTADDTRPQDAADVCLARAREVLYEFVNVRGDFYEPMPMVGMIERLAPLLLADDLRVDWRDGPERQAAAAAEVVRLRAENLALREAIEPLAKATIEKRRGHRLSETNLNSICVKCRAVWPCSYEQLRRLAAAALAAVSQTTEGVQAGAPADSQPSDIRAHLDSYPATDEGLNRLREHLRRQHQHSDPDVDSWLSLRRQHILLHGQEDAPDHTDLFGAAITDALTAAERLPSTPIADVLATAGTSRLFRPSVVEPTPQPQEAGNAD